MEYVKIRTKRERQNVHTKWLHGAGKVWHMMKTDTETYCGIGELETFEPNTRLEIFSVTTKINHKALCSKCCLR